MKPMGGGSRQLRNRHRNQALSRIGCAVDTGLQQRRAEEKEHKEFQVEEQPDEEADLDQALERLIVWGRSADEDGAQDGAQGDEDGRGECDGGAPFAFHRTVRLAPASLIEADETEQLNDNETEQRET
jgi:hypothetical protein